MPDEKPKPKPPPPPPEHPHPVLLSLRDHRTAIIDADLFDILDPYDWHIRRRRRCVYAYAYPANDRTKRPFLMHRYVADTPGNQVCHHRNRNTLDNRRSNLLNLTRQEHDALHRNDTLKIIFSASNTETPVCAHRAPPKTLKTTPLNVL